MYGFLLACCAAVGVAVGSFLNVVIWRLPRQESLARPPSHCPSCEHPIRPYDNVPVVSWLVLRGRCRDCGNRISSRYPLVELTTGALFVFVAARIGLHPSVAGFLYFTAAGVALAMIDFDVRRLPDPLTYSALLVGLVALAVDSGHRRDWHAFIRAIETMAALFGFYLATRVIGTAILGKTAMGLGDVKLSASIGLLLGWLSWGALAVGAFAGFVIGAVAGVALIASGRGKLASRIPYGPYMLLGALTGIVWGTSIAHWYTGLAGG